MLVYSMRLKATKQVSIANCKKMINYSQKSLKKRFLI